MKLYISALLTFFVLSSTMFAQAVSQRPEPLKATSFVYPTYKELQTDNGLRVFIVEDKEQPVVTFRLVIHTRGEEEVAKPGLSEFTAEMLNKGFTSKNAEQISNLIDSCAISYSVSAAGDQTVIAISGLKKYYYVMLGLMNDVLTNATFPEEEFKKMQPQFMASIQQKKSNVQELMGQMSRIAIYGKNHPYSIRQTKESMMSITLDDIKKFHKSYYIPNNANMAVVGEVTTNEIKNTFAKAFASWKRGSIPSFTMPPVAPEPVGVYFVNRPNSVQSQVLVCFAAPEHRNMDYKKLQMAGSYIGGGFVSRLFKTLREQYSYTYSPFAGITGAKEYNRFFAGSAVRNSVTDSTIMVIKQELAKFRVDGPVPEDFEIVKSSDIGSFMQSMENPQSIANYIQLAYSFNEPLDWYKSQVETIQSMTVGDMLNVGNKYLSDNRMYIIVVGAPEVAKSLAQFGKVYEFNTDFEPTSGVSALKPSKYSAEDVFNKYNDALGGGKNDIKSLMTDSKVNFSVQGQSFEGTIVQKQKAPNKSTTLMNLKITNQTIWVNGDKAWMQQAANAPAEQTGYEYEKLRIDGELFGYAKLLQRGYTAKVKGEANNQIVVEVTFPKTISGADPMLLTFDATTFLLTKVETIEKNSQATFPSTVEYSNYIEVAGCKMPKNVKSSNPYFEITLENTYSPNVEIQESDFSPKQ
jgi:zinc protease